MAAVTPIAIEWIENLLVLVRAQKVPLDINLAACYGVTTKRFNEQVCQAAAGASTC